MKSDNPLQLFKDSQKPNSPAICLEIWVLLLHHVKTFFSWSVFHFGPSSSSAHFWSFQQGPSWWQTYLLIRANVVSWRVGEEWLLIWADSTENITWQGCHVFLTQPYSPTFSSMWVHEYHERCLWCSSEDLNCLLYFFDKKYIYMQNNLLGQETCTLSCNCAVCEMIIIFILILNTKNSECFYMTVGLNHQKGWRSQLRFRIETDDTAALLPHKAKVQGLNPNLGPF